VVEPGTHRSADDALRIALSMVRADWQGDQEAWRELWALADDPAAVARELTTLCREQVEHMATVAGIPTAEMLHRLAGKLIPHPEPGTVTLIDLPDLTGKQAT